MSVTQDQARALAQLAVDCRPSGARKWDIQGVYAAIGKVRDRHLADVVLAVIRAADDRSADTPGVINAPGSLHWRERGTERPAPHQPFDASDTCGTCSLSAARCREKWAGDHEFEPIPRLKARVLAQDFDVKAITGALHELAPRKPEPRVIEAPEFEPPEVPADYAAARAQLAGTTVPSKSEPTEEPA